MRKLLARCLGTVWFLSAATAAPAPAADAPIPAALQDWRGWVLKDLDYRGCPFLANSAASEPGHFICAWPGRLNLASSPDGAVFSIRWRVDAASRVALPGDAEHWPQQVTVDGRRLPVLERDGRPELALAPGTHDISGRLPWHEQPQSIAVPATIGLVALSIDGKPVLPIRRDGDALTLGRAAATAPEADNLDLRVYRKLSDGIPALLTTRIVVRAAGQAREEVLGPVLPDGFTPTAVGASWPARLDNDGRLHLQVQPGADTLTIEARAMQPLAAVVARVPAAPWPRQEVWSYEPASRLRVTAASSALQLDPRQAEVPEDWQALPAFALGDGATLSVEERSRGIAPDQGNRLSLQREAWLDFDGGGWFARDRIAGRMVQGWRFDAAAPFTLEQAAAQNPRAGAPQRNVEPLLVTRGAKDGLTGVEWRTPNVDLAAGLRIGGATGTLPVSGWQQTFDNVRATLHFPFGYKFIAAPGADAAGGSWASAWNLLDAFVCAIAVLLAWRLIGAAGAAAVIAYLLLGYQESGSPLWTLIAALGFALVARALPAGRLARSADWLRRGALALLVLAALPFVAAQVRYALYPQLESGGQGGYLDVDALGGMARKTAMAPAASPPPRAAENEVAMETPTAAPQSGDARRRAKRAERPEPKDANAPAQSLVVTGSVMARADRIEHYSQSTVVQTGGGMPNWNLGSTAWLSWNGPVEATQGVRLLIAPPWIVRPLRLLLVALLVWLLVRLFATLRGASAASAPVSAAAIVLACAASVAGGARADEIPGDALLAQLRARLTEAPKCAPACASIAEAQLAANGDAVTLVLDVHAGERVAVPLPEAAAATLKAIEVDAAAADNAARGADGALWLALDRGVHRVQLDYIAHADKLALTFALRPAHVVIQGRGWETSGVADERMLGDTLGLARARSAAGTMADAGLQQFAPYVRVERNLALGLEWTVATTVRRISPAQSGFTVEVPLLAAEHVTSPGIKVHDGRVPVAIGDGQAEAGWQAALDRSDALSLTAPALADRAEVWRILVSPTWHVEFSGVPGVGLDAGENADDYRNFEFHPLPGETLTLRVTRPAPAQGGVRAIDAATLHVDIGQHASTHVLGLSLRASQGGDQVIALPKDAEILGVDRDDESLNVRLLDGRLSLPVPPGEHRYTVRFRDGTDAATIVSSAPVALGLAAANIAVSLRLPADRWLLATWGPSVGPAVLYWGELLVMIAVAFALARTRRTRLRFRDWLLLGLGFSTFSWLALLVVVAWLFAFDWRSRAAMPATRWRFNLAQVALVALAGVALICLVAAIPQGLLGQPDMHVTGNGSTAHDLYWFADRSSGAVPIATTLCLPLWVYKVLMLAWAIWLANALIGWLRDSFAAWTRGGYWQARPAASTAAAVPAPSAATPEGPAT